MIGEGQGNGGTAKNYRYSANFGVNCMVKIDCISGFLGAGKTTFANMLLRYYMDSGLRPVFIVNEFGKTGLDADIIKADGFEALEIEGGCICCTLKDDIAAAIIKVVDAFSPANIVFEPCGIFVFDNFFDILKEPAIYKKCELASVITVVDSVNFSFSKALYGSFVYNQIKNATIILLSKLEKTTNSVDELMCDIKNINPDAFIMSKIWADWDRNDFELLTKQQQCVSARHRAHHHNNLHSITVELEKPFAQDKIDKLIACCTSGAFGNLCRVKGVLLTEAQPVLLNIAMQDVTIKTFKGPSKPALTFVGQTVNEKEILEFSTSQAHKTIKV